MHTAAEYVPELVQTNKLPKTKKEPWWKRQLASKLRETKFRLCEHFN